MRGSAFSQGLRVRRRGALRGCGWRRVLSDWSAPHIDLPIFHKLTCPGSSTRGSRVCPRTPRCSLRFRARVSAYWPSSCCQVSHANFVSTAAWSRNGSADSDGPRHFLRRFRRGPPCRRNRGRTASSPCSDCRQRSTASSGATLQCCAHSIRQEASASPQAQDLSFSHAMSLMQRQLGGRIETEAASTQYKTRISERA